MYYDEEGRFKGEALIIYFKEGSVDLAITLLDDTELQMGAGYGNMRVKVAEYDKSQSANEGKKAEKKEAKDDGEEKEKVERKKPSAEDKQRMSKRIKTMQRYVSL
jgi:HIV Tat-specific factor 1